MAYPGIRKVRRKSFNFFQKLDVNWEQFGAPDGYTVADGYGPDIIINFNAQAISFLNEGATSANTIEYSFDGVNLHGDLTPGTPSAGMIFDNRIESLIWFRLKAGSTGPVTIRIEAWGTA